MKTNIFFTILLFTLISANTFVNIHKAKVIEDHILDKMIDRRFGFEIGTYDIITKKIKKNETLIEILYDYRNDAFEIVSHIDKSILNPKSIKTNNVYKLVLHKAKKELSGIIYKKTDINYILIDLRDDKVITKNIEKKVSTKVKALKGVIGSSLSATIEDLGVDYSLSFKISNLFAWTIDFFKLKKDDYFKIIFEERYVDDTTSIGINNIKAIMFYHNNNPYYAFFYPQKNQYFNENGKSLQKQFLKAPLEYARISSKFSRNRFHPILKIWRSHKGTDYAAPKGTEIISTADGVVSEIGYTRGNGRYIKITHNSIYKTQYLHLWKFKKNLRKGSKVKQGETIGYVGKTGLANGYHVCYRFWENGVQINHLKKKFPSIKSISKTDSIPFSSIVKKLRSELNQI